MIITKINSTILIHVLNYKLYSIWSKPLHRYMTQHRYKHDPNTHANILSNPHYTHKRKRRHVHANRHMRELKCPRNNTHEHKDSKYIDLCAWNENVLSLTMGPMEVHNHTNLVNMG